MTLPPILQAESRVRLIQGAVVGVIATVAVGFGLAGWTLGSTAQEMAEDSAENAVVEALAPICADKFREAANATAMLAELKATDSWKQDSYLMEHGWVTFPGSAEPNNEVAEACAKLLATES